MFLTRYSSDMGLPVIPGIPLQPPADGGGAGVVASLRAALTVGLTPWLGQSRAVAGKRGLSRSLVHI